jgi:uncharacterized membrane protein
VLASIVLLVTYVHHIGQALRVSALIELVGERTRQLVDDRYPDEVPAPSPPDDVVLAPVSGVVTYVDRDRLVDLARRADVVLHLVPAIGGFVPAGAPLFRVEGDRGRVRDEDATDCVVLAPERTFEQDAAYGLRLLVDIAERSLSDSPFQDPTTAVQAIDRLHDCLRQLARRDLTNGRHCDGQGALRLVEPVMNWDAYVHLAFDELRIAGAQSPQVTRRLAAALTDLATVTPPDRREAVDHQLTLLGEVIDLADAPAEDSRMAAMPDGQGIGVEAGRSPHR